MSLQGSESLLHTFGLDSNLSIKNKEQITRIRKKIEKIIEIENMGKTWKTREIEYKDNKSLILNHERVNEVIVNEAKHCSIIFIMTSINYFLLRNNKTIFNNIYTNHIYRPCFVITFLALPNFICLYFAKLNYDLVKE